MKNKPDFDNIRKSLILYFKLKYSGKNLEDAVRIEGQDIKNIIVTVHDINCDDFVVWLTEENYDFASWKLTFRGYRDHEIHLFYYLINKLHKVTKKEVDTYLKSIGL